MNTKRVYRIYREENLGVRTAKRKKRSTHLRVPLPEPTRPNQRWSMDFVSDRVADGRWFRILTSHRTSLTSAVMCWNRWARFITTMPGHGNGRCLRKNGSCFNQERSGPGMKGLKEWLAAQLTEHRTEPNSGLGKASSYLLRHWTKLTVNPFDYLTELLRHSAEIISASVQLDALELPGDAGRERDTGGRPTFLYVVRSHGRKH